MVWLLCGFQNAHGEGAHFRGGELGNPGCGAYWDQRLFRVVHKGNV